MTNYTIQLPQNAVIYIRQVLGQGPHDTVRPIIAALEQQVMQQDRANAIKVEGNFDTPPGDAPQNQS